VSVTRGNLHVVSNNLCDFVPFSLRNTVPLLAPGMTSFEFAIGRNGKSKFFQHCQTKATFAAQNTVRTASNKQANVVSIKNQRDRHQNQHRARPAVSHSNRKNGQRTQACVRCELGCCCCCCYADKLPRDCFGGNRLNTCERPAFKHRF
jgi:hypothetical protein